MDDLIPEEEVPPWTQQITVRGLAVSVLLGVVFSIITHKLSLSIGVIPSLNVAAGLLGFLLVKSWMALVTKLGLVTTPFTQQENTVIQTCVVACYGIAVSGGFGTYLFGMSSRTFQVIGPDSPGNSAQDVKDPELGWMTSFVLTCSFVGIFALVPLRKVMLIDYKLTYPSGTATAMLISSFHSNAGAHEARKQVACLGKSFAGSFAWSFLKWLVSGGTGSNCGFEHFRTLGLKAYANTFYFDFSATFVGTGMLCPSIVNFSALAGAILSWAILWPLIGARAGDWYPAGLEPTNFKGLYGYKVFIAIALILGDGLYNLLKIAVISLRAAMIHKAGGDDATGVPLLDLDRDKLTETFTMEGVPMWIAATGYVLLSLLSVLHIPTIIPALRWYHVLVCYLVAPVFGFCNAYGTGLTDWNLASSYGKMGLFVFGAWVGSSGGGVMAGLGACGLVMSIASTAADLMQDLKTGYLTQSSPRSMFVSQLLGTLLGCFVAPLTFWMFWKAFPDVGLPDGEYKVPTAIAYRQIAILGVQGLAALPAHCLEFCIAFFALALLLNAGRDCFSWRWLPIPVAMAIPFYIGAYFAVDMVVGSLVMILWERLRGKDEASAYGAAVASGLICGDGLWTIPSAVVALLKIKPPMCMTFLPTAT
ncbi:hypothetical protein SELMODRAFT_269976 [Selaginella moellendorffii]|uniref:Uncharacterized protein n=1 Tax=Selaginella moellendorffii TaxID=88036 RepID=D8TAX4_SELML|nr:probable metal-nicotianamine transporter YSL6 [Selaginella moellendorffii]EFJ06229.1 hypothetical protein SELMODRAFT_269976 [Selaginella moellendorffii]|eukprot:XP_002992748.1 probable metal-nicotianamine transporter YSL6 [Selaginella moellendorffii]